MDKSEALRLADELEDDLADYAGQSLPRISQDIADSAAAELRRLHAENASLAAALASSCDEQRHELWESGGIAGCERARVAERQRDALLEALKAMLEQFNYHTISGIVHDESAAIAKARAAIKTMEEGN